MRNALIFVLSLTFATNAVAAPALRCEAVFLSKTQLAARAVRDYRISRHDKSLEKALLRGDQYLEEWVQEHFTLSIGKRLPLKDYIQLNKDQRAEKLLTRMWQEKVTLEGLDAFAEMTGMRDNVSYGAKVKFAIRKSLAIAGKLLSFPAFDLRDTKVTADMLEAWIRQPKKHEEAINKYLYEQSLLRPKGQSQLERYNHLKTAWIKILLIAGVYLTVANWDEDQKEAKEQIEKAMAEAEQKRIQETVSAYEKQISGISDGLNELVRDAVHKSFTLMYERFINEYGEKPSDEELREIIKISYKDYGIKLTDDEAKNEKAP
jgi:hypothetical protein